MRAGGQATNLIRIKHTQRARGGIAAVGEGRAAGSSLLLIDLGGEGGGQRTEGKVRARLPRWWADPDCSPSISPHRQVDTACAP